MVWASERSARSRATPFSLHQSRKLDRNPWAVAPLPGERNSGKSLSPPRSAQDKEAENHLSINRHHRLRINALGWTPVPSTFAAHSGVSAKPVGLSGASTMEWVGAVRSAQASSVAPARCCASTMAYVSQRSYIDCAFVAFWRRHKNASDV